MISFDVISLFTNVPVSDSLSFLRKKLPELDVVLPVPVDVFVKLLELCVYLLRIPSVFPSYVHQ